MESVRSAKQRIRNYPILFSKCTDKAAAYAACVTRDLNIKQHVCEKEFQEFKLCLQRAAKNLKIKL